VNPRVLTGAALNGVRDEALPVAADAADIFAEAEPNQKERIIRALRKAGHVVSYMGDGINDALIRPGRCRLDRSTTPLGHRVHPPLHAHLRSRQLRVRLPRAR